MNYSLANRASGKPELAKIFANSTAQKSAGAGGALAPGSVLVMEIYQALRDEAGNPVIESDGVFKSGELTGIAVMQKRADWPAEYPAQERAGEWGFALYDAKGQPKANDLVCAGCHQPFAEQDFVISRPRLAAAIR
ncbi:MAG: cytochrome P460 family protein [Gammaproteobacteria bacterium]|nr:cytochrome P460 family protein [Gammaproteobacteria bacterium]